MRDGFQRNTSGGQLRHCNTGVPRQCTSDKEEEERASDGQTNTACQACSKERPGLPSHGVPMCCTVLCGTAFCSKPKGWSMHTEEWLSITLTSCRQHARRKGTLPSKPRCSSTEVFISTAEELSSLSQAEDVTFV